MRAALVIAGRILRQRLRDRSAIIFAVVTPLGLAIAFAMVIPDFSPNFHTTFAVVDNDRSDLSRVLTDELLPHLSAPGVAIADIKPMATEAEARAEVEADRAGAAIVVPKGLSAAIRSNQATQIEILAGSSVTAREVARAIVGRFANDVGAVQLTAATVGDTGGTLDAATLLAIQQAIQQPSPINVPDIPADRLQASLATFYGAAMAIMFVFFATQYGAVALLGERQEGTLSRLLAAPIPAWSVILGGAMAGLALGAIAMGVMAVATTLIVHASWGSPILVALLICGAVLAATGISALLSTLTRTAEQAGQLTAIVAICLSAIGGVFIPLSQSPELMGRIALITPHAWFLRAIDTLSSPKAGIVDILPTLGVLTAMGVVTGAIGLFRARRSLVAL